MSGDYYEKVSNRSFYDITCKPGEAFHFNVLHDDVRKSIENSVCTYNATGKSIYFQYLF